MSGGEPVAGELLVELAGRADAARAGGAGTVAVDVDVLGAIVVELADRRARVTTGGPAPAMTPPEVWRNGSSSRPSTATCSPASVVRRGPGGELVEVPS